MLISGSKNKWTKLDNALVWEYNAKLFRMTKDKNLKLDKHVFNICSKVNRKLSTFKDNEAMSTRLVKASSN